MINITKYSKMYGKKPANFLDNPRIIKLIQPGELEKFRGRRGHTLLDEKHALEFLLWLHPSIRAILAEGYTPEEIFKKLDSNPI